MLNMNARAILRGRWQTYRQQNPDVRIRTAAQQVGVISTNKRGWPMRASGACVGRHGYGIHCPG